MTVDSTTAAFERVDVAARAAASGASGEAPHDEAGAGRGGVAQGRAGAWAAHGGAKDVDADVDADAIVAVIEEWPLVGGRAQLQQRGREDGWGWLVTAMAPEPGFEARCRGCHG